MKDNARMEDAGNVDEAGMNRMPSAFDGVQKTGTVGMIQEEVMSGESVPAGAAVNAVPEVTPVESVPVGVPAGMTVNAVPEVTPGAPGESVPAGTVAGAALNGVSAEDGINGTAKKAGFRKKLWGCVEIMIAIAMVVLAGWMFYNTRGARLLYVDVDFGRICKYYWAPAAGALVFFAVGLYTLIRSGREVKKDGKLE